jgi:nucleotide-binding universal stress UspA family protein
MLRSPQFYAVLLERLLHSPTPKEETMHELKHILVVSRMTKYCKNAVHYGISLSKKCGATLYVLHVMENPFKCCDGWNLSVPALTLANEYEKLLHKTKKDLDAVINTEKMNGIKIIEMIRTGDPSEVIMQVTEEKDIDLIIMSAHEEGRLEQFLFGNSNDKIIRRMPCSVLLVKKEPAVFGAVY